MNAWKMPGRITREAQIVLVLQGDRAFWFRQQSHGAVESFTETLETSMLGREPCCPWIKVPPGSPVPGITLLLDSPLDEVDRVKVEGLSNGWLRHLQVWRMTRRLREEYPSASIHRLPAYAAPDVMSVVHHVVPEPWQQWLLHLQEDHVSVTHVATGLELLCRHSASVTAPGREDVLLNVTTGRDTRHLLVNAGVPVFMRLVSRTEDEDDNPRIENDLVAQTLAHVRSQIAGLSGVPQVLQPQSQGDDADKLVMVPRLLAGLYLGEKACFEERVLRENRSLDAVDAAANVSQSVGAVVTPVKRRWHPFMRASGSSVGQWRLTARHRLAARILQVSVVRNRVQRRIRQLQKATLLCAWMAAAMVVVASVHGVASARERARLGIEQKRVGEQIRELTVSVMSLNRNPAFVVRSMERIDAHAQMTVMRSGALLAIVADAVSEFPSLILDDLSWSLVYGEWAREVAFTSVEQMPDQAHIWHEDSPVARMQVELGGTVSSEAGLREQQHTLERFASHLEAMPAVTAVSVLESPVTAARSSDRLVRGQSAYRLSLLLGVS